MKKTIKIKIAVKDLGKTRNYVHYHHLQNKSGAGAHLSLKDKKNRRNSKVAKREKHALKRYY